MPNTSTLCIVGLVAAAVVATRFVTLNISASVPVGLYRRTAVPQPLSRGDLVILPVPRSVWPWHNRWLPLLKPVAAIAGDVVCNIEDELWIDGVGYRLIYTQAYGELLPHLEDCEMVPVGHVFLASPASKSLDSRYIGSVRIDVLSAGAIPLWTWK